MKKQTNASNEQAHEILRDYLETHSDEMVQFTKKLCEFPTENPPGREYKPLADFLSRELHSLGLAVQVIRVPGEYQQRYTPPECWDYPRYNVIARWNTGAKKTLHFNSHFDVVPTEDHWKTDPFSPRLARGRLYGRGTSDMKGCITACIYAIKALRSGGIQPSWNVELSFTCDEEIGGQCGVGYLIEKRLIHPDAAVICEGGAGDSIMRGHRGVLWLDILVKGIAAHGSNPNAGVNAFEKGIALARRFLDYHQQCQQRETRHTMDRPSACRPSMTLGGVSGGGTKVNTIPGDFHFTIDRRLIPEESIQQIKREFRDILHTAMQEDRTLKTKYRVLMDFDAAITDSNAPICIASQKAVENVMGKSGKLCIFGAFTDLHFFVRQAQCPTIGYGVEGDGIHSSNEYLSVRSLADTARVYAEIATTLDSVSPCNCSCKME